MKIGIWSSGVSLSGRCVQRQALASDWWCCNTAEVNVFDEKGLPKSSIPEKYVQYLCISDGGTGIEITVGHLGMQEIITRPKNPLIKRTYWLWNKDKGC